MLGIFSAVYEQVWAVTAYGNRAAELSLALLPGLHAVRLTLGIREVREAFTWSLLEVLSSRRLQQAVWSRVVKYLLYPPAPVASNNHCPGHVLPCRAVIYMALNEFRLVNGSLSEPLLGLTP